MTKAIFLVATVGKPNKQGLVFTEESLKQLQGKLQNKKVHKDGKRVGKIVELEFKDNSLFATIKLNRRGEGILRWEEIEILK